MALFELRIRARLLYKASIRMLRLLLLRDLKRNALLELSWF